MLDMSLTVANVDMTRERYIPFLGRFDCVFWVLLSGAICLKTNRSDLMVGVLNMGRKIKLI